MMEQHSKRLRLSLSKKCPDCKAVTARNRHLCLDLDSPLGQIIEHILNKDIVSMVVRAPGRYQYKKYRFEFYTEMAGGKTIEVNNVHEGPVYTDRKEAYFHSRDIADPEDKFYDPVYEFMYEEEKRPYSFDQLEKMARCQPEKFMDLPTRDWHKCECFECRQLHRPDKCTRRELRSHDLWIKMGRQDPHDTYLFAKMWREAGGTVEDRPVMREYFRGNMGGIRERKY